MARGLYGRFLYPNGTRCWEVNCALCLFFFFFFFFYCFCLLHSNIFPHWPVWSCSVAHCTAVDLALCLATEALKEKRFNTINHCRCFSSRHQIEDTRGSVLTEQGQMYWFSSTMGDFSLVHRIVTENISITHGVTFKGASKIMCYLFEKGTLFLYG